jgi:hypothetical protein
MHAHTCTVCLRNIRSGCDDRLLIIGYRDRLCFRNSSIAIGIGYIPGIVVVPTG